MLEESPCTGLGKASRLSKPGVARDGCRWGHFEKGKEWSTVQTQTLWKMPGFGCCPWTGTWPSDSEKWTLAASTAACQRSYHTLDSSWSILIHFAKCCQMLFIGFCLQICQGNIQVSMAPRRQCQRSPTLLPNTMASNGRRWDLAVINGFTGCRRHDIAYDIAWMTWPEN